MHERIPGGESTTMGILAEKFGLIPPLKEFIRKGFPVMGTCAGLILLSNEFVEESLMVNNLFQLGINIL